MVHGGSRDMWQAYRQISIAEEAQRYCIVAVWDPSLRCWRFCIAYVLLFGLSGAVTLVNRLLALLVALAWRVLAVIVQAFFDDFRILDLTCASDSGWFAFDFAAKFLGVIFDLSRKRSYPGNSNC